MNVVLSIHPEWAKLIYEGKKTLELRKSIPLNTVNIVYLYETAPICKVTGFFKYFAYTRIKKTHLELHKDIITDKSCVALEEIKKYFGKSEEIFGWFCNAGHPSTAKSAAKKQDSSTTVFVCHATKRNFKKQTKSSEALRLKAGKNFQKPSAKTRYPETVGLTNETWIQRNREKERDFS